VPDIDLGDRGNLFQQVNVQGEFVTEKIKEQATVINRYRMPQLGIGASPVRAEIVEKE